MCFQKEVKKSVQIKKKLAYPSEGFRNLTPIIQNVIHDLKSSQTSFIRTAWPKSTVSQTGRGITVSAEKKVRIHRAMPTCPRETLHEVTSFPRLGCVTYQRVT